MTAEQIIKRYNRRVDGMLIPEKGCGTWQDIAIYYLLENQYPLARYAAAKADIEKRTGRKQPFGGEII